MTRASQSPSLSRLRMPSAPSPRSISPPCSPTPRGADAAVPSLRFAASAIPSDLRNYPVYVVRRALSNLHEPPCLGGRGRGRAAARPGGGDRLRGGRAPLPCPTADAPTDQAWHRVRSERLTGDHCGPGRGRALLECPFTTIRSKLGLQDRSWRSAVTTSGVSMDRARAGAITETPQHSTGSGATAQPSDWSCSAWSSLLAHQGPA